MAGDHYEQVGDLVTLVRGTTYKGALVGKPGPALLGLGSIVPGGGFRDSDFKTYGGECPDKLMLRPGDLYVSLKGATKDGEMIGSVAQVPPRVASGRLTQDTVKLVIAPEFEKLRQYLYWLLRSPQYRAYCAGHATGSAVVAMSREDFLAYPVPRLTAFRASVVALLDALDAKIKLNLLMNETLDAMAQAIFRDWFVDFGPTRRKLEGATDPVTIMGGLVQDAKRARFLADLFPTELDDDGLPRSWARGHLRDVLELRYGKSLPKGERRDGAVPVYGSGGIGGFHSEALVQGPSIIVGRKGTVGSLYWEDGGFFPIDTVFYVTSKNSMTYCYYLLRTLGLETMNTDAAVPGLNRENAYRLDVGVPDKDVLTEFANLVGLLRSKISANTVENRTLVATRDLLLPKLISGEIRLREAEERLEAAQ